MKNYKYQIRSGVCSPVQTSVDLATMQARSDVSFHVFDPFDHVYNVVVVISDDIHRYIVDIIHEKL